MRHAALRWGLGRTAGNAAEAATPRPRSRVAWGVALSLLVHAAVLLLPWQRAPRAEAPAAQRIAVRLIARSPQPSAAPAAPLTAPRTAPPRKVARAQPRAPAPAAPQANAAAPQPAPAEPINGSVFGMPRIGWAGGTPSRRWVNPPATAAVPVAHYAPPMAAQAHAARDAGRAHIVSALQRQVTAWPPPADAADAACAMHTAPPARLECNSDALMQVVNAQAAKLSGLLDAYRGMDPQAQQVSIAYSQGRYHLSLNAVR